MMIDIISTGNFDRLNDLMIFCFLFAGVLWLYNNVLRDSNTVINKLLDLGKKVFFITNNSTKTREELVEKANSMNFNVGIVSDKFLMHFSLLQFIVSLRKT